MSSPAASRNPREVSGGTDPAPRRRAGPGSADVEHRLLREAQEHLDRMPGAPGKAGLRDCLDTLQYLAGGSDERGRRPDGTRPSDARRAPRREMMEAAE